MSGVSSLLILIVMTLKSTPGAISILSTTSNSPPVSGVHIPGHLK
ncbi:MAG: hypothetical protein D6748_16430 [Calditrichaeota bacterium]|nr:MAG: hypothetical protein D6748_16430 [Calditrichota bacterium]